MTQENHAKPLLHFRAEGRSIQPWQGRVWGIVTAPFGFSWSKTVQKAGNPGWEIIAGRKRSQTGCAPCRRLPARWRCSRHVSFPFCSELMHNHSDCSAKPPLRNGGAGAAIFTDQIEIVSGLFLFNRCISQQTERCFASPRLVLS